DDDVTLAGRGRCDLKERIAFAGRAYAHLGDRQQYKIECQANQGEDQSSLPERPCSLNSRRCLWYCCIVSHRLSTESHVDQLGCATLPEHDEQSHSCIVDRPAPGAWPCRQPASDGPAFIQPLHQAKRYDQAERIPERGRVVVPGKKTPHLWQGTPDPLIDGKCRGNILGAEKHPCHKDEVEGEQH